MNDYHIVRVFTECVICMIYGGEKDFEVDCFYGELPCGHSGSVAAIVSQIRQMVSFITYLTATDVIGPEFEIMVPF